MEFRSIAPLSSGRFNERRRERMPGEPAPDGPVRTPAGPFDKQDGSGADGNVPHDADTDNPAGPIASADPGVRLAIELSSGLPGDVAEPARTAPATSSRNDVRDLRGMLTDETV